MFGCMVRLYKKVKKAVLRIGAALVRRTENQLRRAWAAHGSRVRTDASYAAITAVVLSGLFGVVPVKDVIAAVLAGLLGVYMNSRQTRGTHLSTWKEDPWDLG